MCAAESLELKLAISLHQSTDAARGAIMPVNRKYDLGTLLDACEYYVTTTRRRVYRDDRFLNKQQDRDARPYWHRVKAVGNTNGPLSYARRRVSFEWALIAGENDSVDEARRLAKMLKRLKAHVNVIPLNPTRGYRGLPSAQSATPARSH